MRGAGADDGGRRQPFGLRAVGAGRLVLPFVPVPVLRGGYVAGGRGAGAGAGSTNPAGRGACLFCSSGSYAGRYSGVAAAAGLALPLFSC